MSKNLDSLLLIKDLKEESIFSIIGRMESLLLYFESDQKFNHLIPFLQTYQFVTKRVAEKYINNSKYYSNYRKIEELDIFFANLYFKPLYSYLVDSKKSLPWKSYFEFCENGYDSAFIQMLVGINVHINADLTHSVYSLKYKYTNDFHKINAILLDTIPELLDYLAFKERDIVGFGGLFLNDFYKYEFKKIIVKWRNNSLKNAKKIKSKHDLNLLHIQTDLLSKKIIELWGNKFNMLNAPRFLSDLNSLEVVI